MLNTPVMASGPAFGEDPAMAVAGMTLEAEQGDAFFLQKALTNDGIEGHFDIRVLV